VQLILLVVNGGLFALHLAATFYSDSMVSDNTLVAIWAVLHLLLAVPSIWAAVATCAKRWHDMNVPGWMALTLIIPGINIVVPFVCGCVRGTHGPNKYGPDLMRASGA